MNIRQFVSALIAFTLLLPFLTYVSEKIVSYHDKPNHDQLVELSTKSLELGKELAYREMIDNVRSARENCQDFELCSDKGTNCTRVDPYCGETNP